MLEPDDRRAEQRLVAEERAADDDRGDRREHDRSEHGRVPPADDLFDDEEHGRDRGVERGADARRGADGRDEAQVIGRQAEGAAEQRRHARAHLQRRVLGAERVARAERHAACDELAGHRAERDAAVRRVERLFRVVDAAAPCGRKHPPHEREGEAAAHGRRQHGPPDAASGSSPRLRHATTSMAMWKQTTSRPPKMPMRIDRSRNRCVSKSLALPVRASRSISCGGVGVVTAACS